MKRFFVVLAVAVCATLLVSCKNKAKQSQPLTQEEVMVQEMQLVDTVLAKIDAAAETYFASADKNDYFDAITLTDDEKLVKPDYLYEISHAQSLVSNDQKIVALGMILSDYSVRLAYGMPVDESKAVITRLALELNLPIGFNVDENQPSKTMREVYQTIRERGNIYLFWKLQYAMIRENRYLIAQNPELYLNRITDEQYDIYTQRFAPLFNILTTLSQYDQTLAELIDAKGMHKLADPSEGWEELFADRMKAIETIKANKEYIIGVRNALLQF